MEKAAHMSAAPAARAASKKQAAQRQKPRILRWRGVLDNVEPIMRRVVAVMFVVTSFAFCFTQLGFVGIDFANGKTAYLVTLLQLVALSALLLGTFAGVAIGLLTGGVLLLHSWFLPLDHFELAYVTPLTSVVMFGVTGLLLGCLFAVALRGNPSGIRRAIYLAIVCVVVSWLYSIGFFFNVMATLAVSLTETMDLDASVSEAGVANLVLQTAMRMGSLDVQAWLDALFMAVLCIVGDFAARKIQAKKGTVGLRTVFGGWLFVVVLLAFFVMSAASFALASGNELREADDDMRDEVAYLCTQFTAANERSAFLNELADNDAADLAKMDDATFSRFIKAYSENTLLEGYAVQDGLVLVGVDNKAYMSNVPIFSTELGEATNTANGQAATEGVQEGARTAGDPGEAGAEGAKAESSEGATTDVNLEDLLDDMGFPSYAEVLGSDFEQAVGRSLETNRMQRFIYDYDFSKKSSGQVDAVADFNPHIAYTYARNLELSLGESDQLSWTYTVIMVYDSDQVFKHRTSIMIWSIVSQFVLMVAVFGIVFLLLNRVVARRIDEENTALSRITAGELDVRATAGGTREIESLSEGINTTVGALKGWIHEAETRMDAELETARTIQESTLPQVFPPYPDILQFDVYAIMHAARHVGGDFYDFFLIGEAAPEAGKLGFVMADVSGKGVPAALFMMKAKAQIRGYLESGMALGEAVENANRQLCDGNDAGMFVTAWIGVLDYGTRHIEYVNAGHNPPLLWSRAAIEASRGTSQDAELSRGGWQWLSERSGMPLGLFDGLPYKSYSLDCQVGDQLLLYTDGVTEAMDVEGGLYGEDRLMDLAATHFALHPRQLVDELRASVTDHARGAEQSDDITILALEVGVPPEVTKTLMVPADIDELPRVNAFVHEELDRRLCPERAQNQLDIAVEELFVNVAHYAYPNATPEQPGMVRISCTYSSDPPSVRVEIVDEGIPYNPLEKPDAVTPDDIREVQIGGLGIFMAKRCVDDMTYERDGSSNRVSILKRW